MTIYKILLDCIESLKKGSMSSAPIKGSTLKMYFAYKDLIKAIIGREDDTKQEVTDAMADAFLCGDPRAYHFFETIAKQVAEFVQQLPYRFYIDVFDGAGGGSPKVFKTLDELIDYVAEDTYFDEEQFGQLACYDLGKGEHISEKVYQYIKANRKRYALRGEDGDYQDEVDTLDEAKAMARDWVDGGISEEVEVYDREENEWVWNISREMFSHVD